MRFINAILEKRKTQIIFRWRTSKIVSIMSQYKKAASLSYTTFITESVSPNEKWHTKTTDNLQCSNFRGNHAIFDKKSSKLMRQNQK